MLSDNTNTNNNINNNTWKYDELSTPITNEQYIDLANHAVEQRLSWLYGGIIDGWHAIHTIGNDNNNNNYVLIEELKLDTSKIDVVRASTVLENVNMDDVVRFYYDGDLNERQKVDPDIMYHNYVEKITDNILVFHSQYKTPFGVTKREFVAMRILTPLENGGFLITIHSINRQDIPFSKDFVRGVSNSSTLLLPQKDGKIQITTVDHIDPKGWIPTMIINNYKKKAGNKLLQIQKVYQKK